MLSYVKTLWQDFVFLFYPKVCLHCGEVLVKNEAQICLACKDSLPLTFHFSEKENNVFQSLVFIRSLGCAAAFLKFEKKGIAQSVLHKLKYKGNYEIGVLMGEWFGQQLKDHDEIISSDYFLPVPIHPGKLRERGYNQSEAIALGLSEVLGIPVRTDVARRISYRKTQTRKGKYDRWQNIRKSYVIDDHTKVAGKVVTLVDDVITTGATVGYLAEILEDSGAEKINVLCLASGK